MSDAVPDCPECASDVLVETARNQTGYTCHGCGHVFGRERIDISARRYVYVSQSSSNRAAYHLDRECRHLANANPPETMTPDAATRSRIRPCTACAYEHLSPEQVDPPEVLACPACDSSNLATRRTRGDVRKRWKCKDCGETFRDAVRRDPKVTPRDTLKGLAKRLSEADPEEVAGE